MPRTARESLWARSWQDGRTVPIFSLITPGELADLALCIARQDKEFFEVLREEVYDDSLELTVVDRSRVYSELQDSVGNPSSGERIVRTYINSGLVYLIAMIVVPTGDSSGRVRFVAMHAEEYSEVDDQ